MRFRMIFNYHNHSLFWIEKHFTNLLCKEILLFKFEKGGGNSKNIVLL